MGSLPTFVSLLKRLRYFSVGDNSMSGTIGPFLAMGTLREIDLSVNFFSGTLPTEMSFMVGLSSLSLCQNLLVGPAPQWLSALTALT